MASATALEKATALQRATNSKNGLDSGLAAGGYNTDLVAVIVEVRYKVVVQKNPASLLSDPDAKALAESLNLEFYEE